MKSTNGVPIPEKDFYDIGVVVDNYKVMKFTSAINKAGYKFELFPFTHQASTIKVLQVPRDKRDEFALIIKKLELDFQRSN